MAFPWVAVIGAVGLLGASQISKSSNDKILRAQAEARDIALAEAKKNRQAALELAKQQTERDRIATQQKAESLKTIASGSNKLLPFIPFVIGGAILLFGKK